MINLGKLKTQNAKGVYIKIYLGLQSGVTE